MAKKFLTLNIGASAIALAEYEASGSKVTLVNYGLAPLAAPLDAGNADTLLLPAISEIVREKGIKPGKVAISVSGQMVFPRFAAIPMAGSDKAKFEQLVRYEIEQNIPFPIDEMVCDREILGETETGDKAVLIVAAKTEQIEAVTTAVSSAGFEPEVIDSAPTAFLNAVRGVKGDEGCVVLLDIGARTTSLVIAEGEKLYNRAIPVAGNTVTKEIAQKLGCTLEEAEGYKREVAYVSMGGVTEDEDPTRDLISKVCRAAMTRLHAEISRSINFYRSQQGGGTPVKMYLAGGTALLPQIDAFFQDSLQIEVEIFNPFETVAAAPALDAERLAADTPFLAANTGLAIREAGQGAINVNLVPASILEARAEKKRIPVVAAASALFVAAGVATFLAFSHSRDVTAQVKDEIDSVSAGLKSYDSKISAAQKKADAAAKQAEELRALIEARGDWVNGFSAIRSALGDELWVESWDGSKLTVRGWKDRVAEYVKKAEAKGMKGTASEILCAKLQSSPAIVSAATSSASSFGKGDSITQIIVELKFK